MSENNFLYSFQLTIAARTLQKMDYLANDNIMTIWHSDLCNPLLIEEMQPKTSTPIKPKSHRMGPLHGKRWLSDNSFAPEANHHQMHPDLEGASNLTFRSHRKKGVPLEPVGKLTEVFMTSHADRHVTRQKEKRRRPRAQATSASSSSSSDRGLSNIYSNIIADYKSSVQSKENPLSLPTLPSAIALLASSPAIVLEKSQEDLKKRNLMLNSCRSKASDEANCYLNYYSNIYYSNE